MNSKSKGKRGELEVAKLLAEHGFKARRGQQYSGLGAEDVVHNIPGIHIEVKRTERFKLYEALGQAESDASEGIVPTVFHRKNGENWAVVLNADDFLRIVTAALG